MHRPMGLPEGVLEHVNVELHAAVLLQLVARPAITMAIERRLIERKAPDNFESWQRSGEHEHARIASAHSRRNATPNSTHRAEVLPSRKRMGKANCFRPLSVTMKRCRCGMMPAKQKKGTQ